MKMIFQKKNLLIFLFVIMIGVGSAYLVYSYLPRIQYIENSQIVDFSNKELLVGFSDNVFIGKVEEKLGTKELTGFPETQYSVKMIRNIKGDLGKSVTVDHISGYRKNTLYIQKGDIQLETGKKYLFVTRYNKEQDWYTIVPVHGNLLIDSEEKEQKYIKEFIKAYKNEKKLFSKENKTK